MPQIDFTPIFKYLDQTKQETIDEIIEEIELRFNGRSDRITNLLDEFIKESRAYHDESKISGYRLTRLEAWAEKAGKKIQVPTNF